MNSYARRLRDRVRQGRTIYRRGLSVDWWPTPDELVCWRTSDEGRAVQSEFESIFSQVHGELLATGSAILPGGVTVTVE